MHARLTLDASQHPLERPPVVAAVHRSRTAASDVGP
jgi:hypothetical protein